MIKINDRTLAVLALLASMLNANGANAQAKKSSETVAAPPRYCIEDFCLGDPITKFNAAQVEPYNVFGSSQESTWKWLTNTYPVCDYRQISISMLAASGRRVDMTFYPYATPRGEHYRVGAIRVIVKGRFSKDQARQLFEEKMVSPLREQRSMTSTFEAWAGTRTKSFGVIDYYLKVDWSDDHLVLSYSHDQIANKDYLLRQDGCLSQMPKL